MDSVEKMGPHDWLLSIQDRWWRLRERSSEFLETIPIVSEELELIDGTLRELVEMVEETEAERGNGT